MNERDDMHGTGVPPAIEFDDYGLPAGGHQREFLEFCGRTVTEQVDADGWDQPARLFAILNPVASAASITLDADMSGTAYRIVELPLDGSNPTVALMGLDLPDDVAGLIVCAEMWASGAPEHAGQPSSDPARIEARLTQAVSRNDESWFTLTPREPSHAATLALAGLPDRLDGLMTDMMRRALGRTVTGPQRPPSHLLATHAMLMAARVLEAMTIDSADPDSMVNALLKDGALPDDAAEHVTAVTRSMVAWQASGHGCNAPEPARELLDALGTGERIPASLSREEAALLEAVISDLAHLTWVELDKDENARAMLPAELEGAFDAAWCGEVLAGRTVFRFAPDPQLAYEHLARVYGASMANACASGLSAWWTPGSPPM